MDHSPSAPTANEFELRFQSLVQVGRALTFPCDRQGHVDLDQFSERLRNSYLFARPMMGREYAWPLVAQPLRAAV